MRVLILGVTGMLGNAMFRLLSGSSDLVVYGTARNESLKQYFSKEYVPNIITGIDAENYDSLTRTFAMTRPEIVVNCVGLIKQSADANDPLQAISINSLLPHRIATLCQAVGARLVHFGTDCVFSGAQGNYLESDLPDARDLYGRSKLMGEVDYPHAITLRTSIVGHELFGHKSLLEWFLAQHRLVKGYEKAIFSGLPTVELACVVRDYVLPQPGLRGVYHVASKPINKHNLLQIIGDAYGKDIEIIASDELVVDRSLNGTRFQTATGYAPPEWPELVQRMFAFQ